MARKYVTSISAFSRTRISKTVSAWTGDGSGMVAGTRMWDSLSPIVAAIQNGDRRDKRFKVKGPLLKTQEPVFQRGACPCLLVIANRAWKSGKSS